MISPSDDSTQSVEQQDEPLISAESVPQTEANNSAESIPPSLLYLTFTLLPDDQHSDGRPVLPGIHSPDEIAHFFPMLRESQLNEVRSHLPAWIAEYEQVLVQRQIERAKAEAAKPKSLPPKSPAFNQRPAHVESISKPTPTKEVRGKQRSLFDLS